MAGQTAEEKARKAEEEAQAAQAQAEQEAAEARAKADAEIAAAQKAAQDAAKSETELHVTVDGQSVTVVLEAKRSDTFGDFVSNAVRVKK